jgi:hypothetical protein
MFGLDVANSYFLVVAMAALLVAVLVWQPRRNGRTVVVWLASGAVGMVLGSIASYVAVRLAGYELARISPESQAANAVASTNAVPAMGDPDCPLPKGYLINVVRKLDILTSDFGIALTAEQAASISDCLRGVETTANISNRDAKTKYHRLVGELTPAQKARLTAIGLPQPGSDGPAMGPATLPSQASTDVETKAFKSLRERLASRAAGSKAETPKAPPAKTEAPRAQPPKADASKGPDAKS